MARDTTYRLYSVKDDKYISTGKSKACWQNPTDALAAAKRNPGCEIHLFNMKKGNGIYTIKTFETYCVLTSEAARRKAERAYQKWRNMMVRDISIQFKAVTGITINNINEIIPFANNIGGHIGEVINGNIKPLIDTLNDTDFDFYVATIYNKK